MIFNPLSIFARSPALRLPKNAAIWADCLLCTARTDAGLVCSACIEALPRNDPACPRCALPMPARETCGECLRRPPAFDAAIAPFEYGFPLDRLVQRFKFGGDLAAGRWLAERLAEACAGESADLLVVPALTASRLRQRGFNQALQIARVVGAATGVRVDARAVTKVRETAPQPELVARERRRNLRDAFHVRHAIGARHVAVIDDVMTTGATMQAIALELKRAGATRVDAWVVARTPAPRR